MQIVCVCFFMWKIADSYYPRQKKKQQKLCCKELKMYKQTKEKIDERFTKRKRKKKRLWGVIVLFAKQNCCFCKRLFNCWYEFSLVIKYFPGSDRHSLVERNKSREFELCAIGSRIYSNISWISLYFLLYVYTWCIQGPGQAWKLGPHEPTKIQQGHL